MVQAASEHKTIGGGAQLGSDVDNTCNETIQHGHCTEIRTNSLFAPSSPTTVSIWSNPNSHVSSLTETRRLSIPKLTAPRYDQTLSRPPPMKCTTRATPSSSRYMTTYVQTPYLAQCIFSSALSSSPQKIAPYVHNVVVQRAIDNLYTINKSLSSNITHAKEVGTRWSL